MKATDQRGARCALCRLSKTRADSRRGAWPSRRRIRKHTMRCPRRLVSLASRHTLASGLAFGVAARGRAPRRRLSERYYERDATLLGLEEVPDGELEQVRVVDGTP